MELYKAMGLDKSATADEIKEAYRKLVKAHHPDKGGDAEIFKKINRANAILSDSEKRKRYDETGDTGDGLDISPEEQMVLTEFMNAFQSWVVSGGHSDLMATMRNSLQAKEMELRSAIRGLETILEKGAKLAKRIKRSGGPNFIQGQLEHSHKNGLKNLEEIKGKIALIEKAQMVLEEYSFDPESGELMRPHTFVWDFGK